MALKSCDMNIIGESFKDERGTINFFNEFNMLPISRMYMIESPVGVVRAWQGHKKETKWFYVLEGEFLIQTVQISSGPEFKNRISSTICKSDLKIFQIEPGNYNGFQALKSNSKLLVFSNFSLSESKGDDYRLSTEELNWKKI
jgi:dTDP-4-dehydrorhamnose 3,5-epimerase